MGIFIDTSAFYALSCAEDHNYSRALKVWEELLNGGEYLITNNYVVVESISLFQNRFGLDKVRMFQSKMVPFLDIDWIDQEQHATATNSLLTANRRNLSLVDCVAFETMHRLNISTAFTFDAHFREHGFNIIP